MDNNNLTEEERKWLDKLNKYVEKCKRIDAATCWETDKEVAESIQNCRTNFNKIGLYIVCLPKIKKFVIGYKPKYFHDASFAPLIVPISGKKITDMEDLLRKIKLTDLFDCENKSSFSMEELKVLDKFINNSEFLQYLKDVDEKKNLNKDCKLLKISSIVKNDEKEF